MNWPWLPWAQKSLGGPVPGWVHQSYWNRGEGSVRVSALVGSATQRPPQPRRQIGRDRLAGGLQGHAQQDRVDVVVVEALAGRLRDPGLVEGHGSQVQVIVATENELTVASWR